MFHLASVTSVWSVIGQLWSRDPNTELPLVKCGLKLVYKSKLLLATPWFVPSTIADRKSIFYFVFNTL